MLRDKSMLLKLEFIISISINYASMCTTCRRRRCGADNDARSRVWAVSGSSDTMGLPYGPIGIVVSLGSGRHGEGGSQNVGGKEAIWWSTAQLLVLVTVSEHPMWDSVQPGKATLSGKAHSACWWKLKSERILNWGEES